MDEQLGFLYRVVHPIAIRSGPSVIANVLKVLFVLVSIVTRFVSQVGGTTVYSVVMPNSSWLFGARAPRGTNGSSLSFLRFVDPRSPTVQPKGTMLTGLIYHARKYLLSEIRHHLYVRKV